MKRLLIITGPQGSGNHLFSRIFSQHPDVRGWDALKDTYWVPSDREPFAEYWVYPGQLTEDVFEQGEYFLANVSAPFFYDGVRQFPKIAEVAHRAQDFGIEVVIAIVSRDKQINSWQQQRVGGEITLLSAQDFYKNTLNDFELHFISHETFFTWGKTYIDYLGQLLKFPVQPDAVWDLIDESPNRKYISPVMQHWLDTEIRAGRRPFSERMIDILKGNTND
jgi:hypothetical protein